MIPNNCKATTTTIYVSLVILAFLNSVSAIGQSNLARITYRDTALSFEQATAAQMIQMQIDQPNDTGEGSQLNTFSRWAEFMGGRICTDAPQGQDQLSPASTALNNYIKTLWKYCKNSNGYSGNWKNLGPFINSYGGTGYSGRIDALWVDSADQGFILAGANTGGLWKSTDTGHHWVNISDNNTNSIIPGTMGVYDIAVSPQNHDNIYINTGNGGADDYSYGYATGLAYTNNGGGSWQYDSVINSILGVHIIAGFKPVKIAYMPGTQRLFVAWDTVVYEKNSPSSSWQKVVMPGLTGGRSITDFEFSRQNSTTIIFSIHVAGGTTELKTFNTSTTVWTTTSVPLPSGFVQIEGPMDLSLSSEDLAVTIMKTIRLSDSLRQTRVVYTNLTTGNSEMMIRACSAIFPYTCPSTPATLEVSPSNSAIIYGSIHNSGDCFLQSTDSGKTFYLFNLSAHADGRCVKVFSTTNTSDGVDDIVYGGTDGGIARKAKGELGYRSIVGDGLCISQFYGFGSSEAAEGMIGGGAQDNSIYSYIKGRVPEWYGGILGGDGYNTKFARKGNKTMYAETNFPKVGTVDFSTPATLGAGIAYPSDHNGLEYWNAGANKARPLYFDTANIAHMGVFSIWREYIGGTGWHQLFSPEPKPNNGGEFYQVLKFILPEKEGFTSSAYVAYKGVGSEGNDHDPTRNGHNASLGRLYYAQNVLKSSDLNTPHTVGGPIPWRNITPGAVGWWRMTDFEIDPENPARIWVALGDIQWGKLDADPASDSNRVFYSSNYGATWTDVSKGLPPLPCNKIVYQKGTDDILYVGTDVGVFVWNKADGQWCQFNTGLPPSIVTGMEINYCEGKLLVSTFGRGIWECDIMNESNNSNPGIGDFVPNQTSVISTNTNWRTDKYIETGVRILSGATLTINNIAGAAQTVIHMPKNGAIVVDPGGTLIVDGAKITNDCSGLWKGILVTGTPSQPQSNTSAQGLAYIKNGAIIENARLGVANYGESVNTPNSAGGIIYIANSTFKNCARGVGFGPYHNQVGKVIKNNLSAISHSTFIVDDDFRGENLNYPFQAHVNMSNVDGILISGNSFKNVSTKSHTANTGQGIISWNASFNAVPYCPTAFGCPPIALTHNTFEGFNIAIYSNNALINPLDYCYVDYAHFKNNGIGLYAKFNHWCEVFHNSFEMDWNGAPYSASCHCQKGIWLYKSDQFRVEENTFSEYASGTAGRYTTTEGARIESCDANVNDLYRNNFTHLWNDIVAWGVNAQLTPSPSTASIGFQASCNVFDNSGGSGGGLYGTPISINGTGDYKTYGIRSAQGSMTTPVENKYTPSYQPATSAFNVWNQFDNRGQGLDYYHGVAGNTTIEYRNYSAPLNSTYQHPITTNSVNSCAMRTIRTAFGGPCYGCLEAIFIGIKDEYIIKSNVLISLIDGGDSPRMLNAIDGNTYGTALADTLQNIAPYLSDEVLREAAANSRVPATQMVNILTACPDMLTEDLLNYLENEMVPPFSSSDITLLRTHVRDTSTRTRLVGDMNDAYAGMSLAHEDLMASMMLDTNGVNVDSILYWYHQFPAAWARYHEAFIRLGQHDYDGAQTTLTNIPLDFSLSSEETAEWTTYKDVITLLQGAFQDNRTELKLDSAELASLATYSDLEHGAASRYALNLYNQNLGIISLPCDLVTVDSNEGGNGSQSRITFNSNNSATNSELPPVSAYPNPAKSTVTFSYNLPNAKVPLSLQITTVAGKAVWTTLLSTNRGSIQWNAGVAAPGIYLYKVVNGQKTFASGKISIER